MFKAKNKNGPKYGDLKGHKKACNSGILEERMGSKQEKSQMMGVRAILGAMWEGLDSVLRVWDIQGKMGNTYMVQADCAY